MGRDDFLKGLEDPAKCTTFAAGFLREVIEPAFGSRSKGEIEALILKHLANAGLIDFDSPTYDLARALNVTTAKARNITLQYQIRCDLSDRDLDSKLREAFGKARFGRDGTYLAFGLESPILKEHLFAHLKQRGTFADSSFSKEIVRLPVDAFVDFVEFLLPPGDAESVRKALVKFKIVEDTSFQGVAKGVLRKLAEKVGDKALGAVADAAADQLSDFVKAVIRGDGGGASKIVSDSMTLSV